MDTRSFHPPLRTLMGPGPSDVHPRVLAAMARPTIGHLDPAFIELMDDLKLLLQHAFKTENRLTMPISGPGTVGMEACIANLLEPGEKVVVCRNGVFGGRMKAMAERCGGDVAMVEDAWGEPVDPAKVEEALSVHPDAKVLFFVHAETSTGARSDARTLAEIARKHGVLTLVDTVTSLGGIPLDVDGWGLDAVYSGSQKCLSCAPGLSPITFSERALKAISERKTPVQSWFSDLNLIMGYWGSGAKRSYHHTAPVNALYGLHESLVMLHEEGLENAWARHQRNHLALRAGLEALGLDFVVSPDARLPVLNAVRIPDGIDDGTVRGKLLGEYSLEIGGGLGVLAGKVWRIGLMGAASTPENVARCVDALDEVLCAQGCAHAPGSGLAAMKAAYE